VTVDFGSAEGYEDLSVDDYVNYAVYGGVYRIEKATVVSGQIESKASASYQITIDGITYLSSEETNASDLMTYIDAFEDLQFLHNYTFYLDSFGAIIALDESQTTVTETTSLLLLSAEESGGVYTVTTSLFPSDTYTLDADNTLTLQAFAACDNDPEEDSPVLVSCTITESVLTVNVIESAFTDSITKGTAQIGVDGADPVNADDSTDFYYYSTSEGEYDFYLGIDNAPTVDGSLTDAYYLPGDDGIAGSVLIITEDPVVDYDYYTGICFLMGPTAYTTYITSDGTYYSTTAIIDGVKTPGVLLADDYDAGVYEGYEIDDDGYYRFRSGDLISTAITAIESEDGGVITINGTAYSYSEDVIVCYYDDSSDRILTSTTIGSLVTNSSAEGYYALDDGIVIAVFIYKDM
jgi:hypothetical protein